MKINTSKLLEWGGVFTAILYYLTVLNINAEFLGFALLLISSFLIALWYFMDNRKGILFL